MQVHRSYKREGEPDADFINMIAFGARGEFAGKYFKKGMMVAVVGELRISSYTDKDGNKKWSTDVVVSEQHFAEQEDSHFPKAPGGPVKQADQYGFTAMDFQQEEDLPFN